MTSKFPITQKMVKRYKKILKPGVVALNNNYFLEGTTFKQEYYAFIFCNGGLGDYVNFLAAMVWAAEENPQCIGRIYAGTAFLPLAKHVMREYKGWEVRHHDELPDAPEDEMVICYPKKENQLITAIGAHLMDLGSMYYANLQRLPESHNVLPRIRFDADEHPWRWPELKGKPYGVITPYATAAARVMYPKHFRTLVEYTKSKGLTPVFLGNKDHALYTAQVNNQTNTMHDYDFSDGVDLTGKTSLLEAIQIMGRAQFVAGIDNGLLHMAGMTDVPIIFGHTITTVQHRDIRRKTGLTINVFVEERDLACIGCQSKMRYVRGHRFSECFYKSKPAVAYKCLDLLFASEGEAWKRAIDHMTGLQRNTSRMTNLDMNVTD